MVISPICRQTESQGVFCVDTGFYRPRCAASFILVEQGRVAIIETGAPRSALPILQTLEALAIAPETVDWIIVTHVHLDHAGGAGELARHLPRATVVAHPRGLRHLIDPSKLEEGSKQVYGEPLYQKLYGKITPVPAERSLAAEGEITLSLNGRPLTLFATSGHAHHHLCVWDPIGGGLFTGDAFGISYREFDTNGEFLLFAATTPTQFDPEAAHRSIDRIAGFQPRRIHFTHFDTLSHHAGITAELHRQIDDHVALALSVATAPDRFAQVRQGLATRYLARLQEMGCSLSREHCLELLDGDLQLNAQGLVHWLDKRENGG